MRHFHFRFCEFFRGIAAKAASDHVAQADERRTWPSARNQPIDRIEAIVLGDLDDFIRRRLRLVGFPLRYRRPGDADRLSELILRFAVGFAQCSQAIAESWMLFCEFAFPSHLRFSSRSF